MSAVESQRRRGSCPAVDDAHHHQATPPVLTALGLDVRLSRSPSSKTLQSLGGPLGGAVFFAIVFFFF